MGEPKIVVVDYHKGNLSSVVRGLARAGAAACTSDDPEQIRNADGLVIMYADEITPSMRAAIDETERRRSIQDAYNKEHGIVPKTIIKGVREILEISQTAEEDTLRAHKKRKLTEQERAAEIAKLEKEMKEASKMLEFEYAAVLRDRIIELRGEK